MEQPKDPKTKLDERIKFFEDLNRNILENVAPVPDYRKELRKGQKKLRDLAMFGEILDPEDMLKQI